MITILIVVDAGMVDDAVKLILIILVELSNRQDCERVVPEIKVTEHVGMDGIVIVDGIVFIFIFGEVPNYCAVVIEKV